jgi:hypothetical protein
MSVLPPQVHAELTELLQALQSSDNTVRSQAEDHLATNWTSAKPEMLLMGLVEQIYGSNDTTVSRDEHYLFDSKIYWQRSCNGNMITDMMRADAVFRCCYFPPNSFEDA